MTDKVITAVFGKDLRIQLKKRELSASGTKIKIVPAGEGYFMPEIGPTTFLDWPSRKRYLFFGARTHKRVFFAQKLASKCVDFGKEDVVIHTPDPEQLKRANAALLAEKIGQDAQKGTPWYIWALILLQLLAIIILVQ